MFILGFLALFAQLGRAADALNYTKNYFVTGDYVVGGVGLRGKGVSGFATGTINISGVPAGADIVAAFLYWETDESTPAPSATNGFFDGNAIVGDVRGNPMNPQCSSSGGSIGPAGSSGRVYRADVLRYLPVDQTSSVRLVNGNHTVKLPDSGGSGTPFTDGATLVVVYRVLSLGTPLRAVVIYDGAYTMNRQTAAMTQTMKGFYQASASPAAKMTQIAANGQSAFHTTLYVNGATIITNPTPFRGSAGVRWDNPTYSITLAQNAASYSTEVTTGDNNTCLTWSAIVTSTNVTDTDGDGLLDVWETKGLHLNDQVSPATFGGCSDYPADPCVNLPAMGALPKQKDIFVQIDWLHGTDGHLHIPKLAALTAIGDTFNGHGIRMHFDVGNNYQGLSPYIVSAYAQGGQVIEESTLACPNAVTQVCAFPGYSVLSWKIGFQAVKDGFPPLNIAAHFAHNRKDSFHYVLFAHGFAIPSSTPGVPNSVSGVGDRWSGDAMVTLGLWPGDDPPGCDPTVTCINQTGTVQEQAGTLMHELGHNLGLAHGGPRPVPNCMPNYQSVMNYLYQVHGLLDSGGLFHIDYSSGLLPGLNENSLTATSLGNTLYKVRFYGPVVPPASPAALHCDGTPITDGAMEARIDSPIGRIDWQNNGFSNAGPFALDINFNGFTGDPVQDSVDPAKAKSDPTKRWFADYNDWGNLNLQQISARQNVGGLSVDVTPADLGQADFGQADFGQADFGQADFGQADFGQADFGDFPYTSAISTIDATSSSQPLTSTSSDSSPGSNGMGMVTSRSRPVGNATAAEPATGTTLNWGAPNLGQIRHYYIYRSDPLNPTPVMIASVDGAPPVTTYTDTVNQTQSAGPAPAGSSAGSAPYPTYYNTSYTYYVTAVDINGTQSSLSNSAPGIVPHLFITANPKTRVYGDLNPALDATITGTDQSTLTGTLTCTTTAVQTSNVGTGTTYPITCSGESSTNPIDGITYVTGYLTITQAQLTIAAVTNTRTYDGTTSAAAIPTVTGLKLSKDTVTGLAETYNDKNVGMNTKTLSVSAYTVNDGNNGGNYAVTMPMPTAVGTINKAILTITATGINKVYNGNTAATVTLADNRVTGDVFTDSYTSATFSDKNVANGKTVSVSGISISGTDAGNYTFNTTTSTTANITPFSLTVTATGMNKTYNGNTAATVTLSDNRFTGDMFTDSYTGATFSDKNVANGKTVSVSGISISGTDAGNYTFNSTASTMANITPASLTVTATGVNKTYNGNTTATVTLSDNRVLNDMFIDSYTSATFSDKNVANGKTVSVTGISISGTDSGNYMLSNTTASTTANITPASLTVTATGVNKTYNGNTAATVTLSDNRVLNDMFTDSYTSATFSDKNVANGKTVSVSGISISGTDAGNYMLFNTTASTTANITAASLTVTATGVNKTYNGNTAAMVTLSDNRVLNDVFTDSYASATFSDKNVANGKTVSVSGISISGTDAGNYMLFNTTASTTANINAASLTVTATGVNKTYNGNTAATVTLSDNRVLNDMFTDSYTSATFSDKNVANGKTVSVSGISISGTDSGNYMLSNTTASTTANITAASLTVTATGVNKTYNGNTAAMVTLSDNRVLNDMFTDSYTSATFSDKNVANGKTVSVSGISISGTDAGNYMLFNTTASTMANITAASLTVTATGVNKTYDGGTAATVTLSDNRVLNDVFTDSYTSALFSDKNVANNKPVSVSGISISGTDAGNYTLFNTTASTTANITALSGASVTPNANSKTYDGSTATDPTLTGTLSGFVASDGVTATYSRTPGETVAGSPYTISATLSPASVLSNYIITYNTANFTITKATPVISWSSPAPIVYGTPLSAIQLNAATTVAGGFTYTPSSGTILNAGSNQTLQANFTPADAVDYNTASASVLINVSPAPQTITFSPLANKTFGDPDFSVSAAASSGLLVAFTASGSCTATLDGTDVQLTNSGTCTITASQGGNGNYLPAVPVAQMFTVNTLYTSDTNLADFTAGILAFAQFDAGSGLVFDGPEPGLPYTPTASSLNGSPTSKTAYRVYPDETNPPIVVEFPTAVSKIRVFPNIDHPGDAYDGYQYAIYGCTDAAGTNCTLQPLYDPTAVIGSGEGNCCAPFTLVSFTGTAPFQVNNVLTDGVNSGIGPGGVLGYEADFQFSTAYQYYKFTASTVAKGNYPSPNLDEELSGVGAIP